MFGSGQDGSSFSFGGPGGGGGGGAPFGRSGGRPAARAQAAPPQKAQVVTQPVKCTLEDLFKGFTKKLKVTKKKHDPHGRITSEANVHEIKGKPGWKAGTKITFSGAVGAFRSFEKAKS